MQQSKLALRALIFSLIVAPAWGASFLFAQSSPRAASGKVSAKYVRLPLSFEPCSEVNCGPGHEGEFLARGPRGAVLIAPGEIAISLPASQKPQIMPAKFELPRLGFAAPRLSNLEARRSGARFSLVRMKLLGANPRAKAIALDELPGKSNYFIGNDPRKWRTDVPNYARLLVKDVYPGIDVAFHGKESGVRSQESNYGGAAVVSRAPSPESRVPLLADGLEYDFVVHPGADPKAIIIAVENGNWKIENGKAESRQLKISIDRNGGLVLQSPDAAIRLQKPLVYQASGSSSALSDQLSVAANPESRTPLLPINNRQLPDARFHLYAHSRIGFALGAYDHTQPLVIDPVLIYSTYLGGTGQDSPTGIALDSSGSAYVAGLTLSLDFPTQNPLQPDNAGSSDAFVTKLSATGDAVVYSTYLGGSNSDGASGIAVDTFGNAYLTGFTFSTDFPTLNPFQARLVQTQGSDADAFVTKLNAGGNALVYSTFLGGARDDKGLGIAVDSSGDAYVTGYTISFNFPTFNPIDATYDGSLYDAFVTELNAAGDGLIYSTYLGGSNSERGYGIAVDSSGSAYVTGYTSSADFPTVNPVQPNFGGGHYDAFVTKFTPQGLAIAYSTYLGGNADDAGTGIAVDSSDNAYVTGFTNSHDFTTHNPLQGSNAGDRDAFVAKLNAAGSALLFSTYLGGPFEDSGAGIAVDSSGDAYVAGYTVSTDFPTQNPLQAIKAGGQDVFLAEFNPAGSALLQSTYLGGTGADQAIGVAVDGSGNVYLTGTTSSTDFPTLNPLQSALASTSADLFVTRFSLVPVAGLRISPTHLNFSGQLVGTTASAQTITITNIGDLPLTVTSITSSGDFDVAAVSSPCSNGGGLDPGLSCGMSITFKPTASGARTGAVTIVSNAPASPFNARLSGTGTDFSVAAQPGAATSATVTAGGTATYNLQLSPVGFSGQVQLGCVFQGSAPARASCSVSPTAVSLNGSDPAPFTVSVTTAAQSVFVPSGIPFWPRTVLLLLMGAMILAVLTYPSLWKSANRIPALRWAAPLGALLLMVALWTACGSGGTTYFSTPAGSYKLTVTATAGGVNRTTTLTLKVN